jgi:FkbH-like protein
VKLLSRLPQAVRSAEGVTQRAAREVNRSGDGASENPEPTDLAARRAIDALLKKQQHRIARDWATRHLALDEVRSFVGHVASGKGEAKFYRDAYLAPLLELLRGAVTGAGSAWRAVYLDERTRFLVPAEVQIEARQAALGPLLAADVADLVERLPLDYRGSAASILTALHAPLSAPKTAPVRLLLIGDCVMTELRAFLTGRCRDAQIDVEIRHQYLSFERGISLNMPAVTEHVQSGAVDVIALSFFTFEGLPLYRALLAEAATLSNARRRERIAALVQMVHQVVASLRAVSDVPILLHNACGLPLDRLRRRLPFLSPIPRAKRKVLELLNAELKAVAQGIENVLLVDELAAIQKSGLRRAANNLFPKKIRHRALFHTSAFGPALAEAYIPPISAYARLHRTKVLCVDFDNTLWDGVMADGDVTQHARPQRILRQLREAGILLVALSKNDPHSIRWREMELQPDDFVLHKISWNQKVQSLQEAAQQLNLGLDSFVVIDDNPAERALIARRFPEVCLLDPTDPSAWTGLEYMLSFPNTRQTAESAARTSLYREAAHRREAMVADLDYPAMMASLELRATWSQARLKDLTRVHELLQRTNQFNTTTRRQTPAELRMMMTNPQYGFFICSLADRFGDLGVVGVVLVHRAAESFTYEAVVMSCRAMGFGLEMLLVRAPLDHVLRQSGRRVAAYGLYVRTEKNEPAASLFKQAGFTQDPADEQRWMLPADAPPPEIPRWLSVTNTDAQP